MENRRLSQIVGNFAGELFVHRKRTILSVCASGILGLGIAFALPKEYQSSSTFLITVPNKTADLSALAGGLDGGSLSSILGGGSGNRAAVRELMSILETRELALAAIDTFQLDSIWKIKRFNWERLQKKWATKFDFLEDENGAIILSFKENDTLLTKKVVVWVGGYVEHRFQKLKQSQMESELSFLSDRTRERKSLFEAAEDSLLAFQKSNKMYVPEEQLSFLATSLMEKEKSLEELDQKIKISSMEAGSESQPVKYLSGIRQQVDYAINKMLDSAKSSSQTHVSKSIPISLQKALLYNRLHREALIQGKIYAYLLQQQEQISIEKQKSFPALHLIDAPKTPTKKIAPPRMAIVAFFVFLGFIANAFYIFFRTDLAELRVAFLARSRTLA